MGRLPPWTGTPKMSESNFNSGCDALLELLDAHFQRVRQLACGLPDLLLLLGGLSRTEPLVSGMIYLLVN